MLPCRVIKHFSGEPYKERHSSQPNLKLEYIFMSFRPREYQTSLCDRIILLTIFFLQFGLLSYIRDLKMC